MLHVIILLSTGFFLVDLETCQELSLKKSLLQDDFWHVSTVIASFQRSYSYSQVDT